MYSVLNQRTNWAPIDDWVGRNRHQNRRFILVQKKINFYYDIRALGIDPDNIGVHSVLTGGATYCSSGTTTCDSFVAICVRAGWSIGVLKDRYIKDADQVSGRTVAGLDMNSHKFSVSPLLIDTAYEENDNLNNTPFHSSDIALDVLRNITGPTVD